MRNNIFKFIVLLALFGWLATFAVAQERSNSSMCPIITVSCPDWASDSHLTFSASFSGIGLTVKPTYRWSVSAGNIISGQGTSSITVDVSGLFGQSFTGSVEVGGLPSHCSNAASCSTSTCVLGSAQKVDHYGDISFGDEKLHLDILVIELEKDSEALGYIIAYAGRRGRAGQAQARVDRAKGYLEKERGIDPERIVAIDGGHREELTVELFIAPIGATPPTSTPTVEPSDVEIITGYEEPVERPGQP